MPRVLRPGDKIKQYQLGEQLSKGAMANAFVARDTAGRKVFFKQYISPAVGKEWFNPYVTYQEELNARVMRPALQRFCVHRLESFVFKFGVETFFQVYEFVEGGHDLGKILERLQVEPTWKSWDQRAILAKVMMAGINQLHEQNIVHCDLKPPNLQMLIDPTITAGHQLKLIDMDFSILSDKKAPWDGREPYVGTPRYFSPEHMGGKVPRKESDVFTCGLMLYELLGEGHPYMAEDDAGYAALVKAYAVAPPKLVGALDDRAATAYLAAIIHRCLSPKMAERPTAKEVNLALNGRKDPGSTIGLRLPTSPAPTPTAPPPTAPVPSIPPVSPPPPVETPSTGLRLAHTGSGATLTFNVTATVGRTLLRQFGDEARFADEHQYTLDLRGDEWWLVPRDETPNQTVVNGAPALAPVRLRAGDTIELGSRASSRRILPVTVKP